jgi:hypothetical protein
MKLASLIALLLVAPSRGHTCDRTPKKAEKPKANVDKYVIEIAGSPDSYSPGQVYSVILKSNPSNPVVNYFTEFMLVVEPENPTDVLKYVSTGELSSIDPTITTFTPKCPNAVIQTNTLAKSNVSMLWRAPPSGNGCVAIKATVFESSDSWFADDGGLTKVLCEEEENEDVQAPFYEECCACDEAKYEIAFQGLWSRNTHPKDYPANMWTTKLSDVVGASHKYSKSFWSYGEVASEGLKLLAEEGNTTLLEEELKEMIKSDDIRTIIKARELSYPHITGTSYTVFRVDRENHLISLVSKIIPSPDWIVGVANLELCTKNCSWVASRTLNLYPWDAGTDDGVSYNSPDAPSTPPQAVKMITTDNEESPFYDKDGERMKPMARLIITRQKLYEKPCETSEENSTSAAEPEWSECSVSCGQGVQTRPGKDCPAEANTEDEMEPDKENEENQEEPCSETRECVMSACEENTRDVLSSESQVLVTEGPSYGPVVDCKMSRWSGWSECVATEACTDGYQLKKRTIQVHPRNGGRSCPAVLQRRRHCRPSCGDEPGSPGHRRVDCVMGEWSEWSPCSRNCGSSAVQQRTRMIKVYPSKDGQPCGPRKQEKKCTLPYTCNDREMQFL